MSEEYHIPVLLHPSIDGLNLKEDGIYVDLTFGGGGHSREILNQLRGGKLIVFDQDEEAYLNRPKDDRVIFVRHNFRYLHHFLKYLQINEVDGILADLGVSSHHFDTPERGFSFRFSGDLDMRMNQKSDLKASDVLNEYDEERLFYIFKNYGEIKQLNRLVKVIVAHRSQNKFSKVEDLVVAVEGLVLERDRTKFLAKVFQAIRIEVNKEMEALKEMLQQTLRVLKPGGRLVVISYHSLEDRLVKNFIRSGNCEKMQPEKDFYGKSLVPWMPINKKLIVPTVEEINDNNRARSAKLRIAEKL